jgi:hypothetical protein
MIANLNNVQVIAEILRTHPWTPNAVSLGFKPILSETEAEARAAIIVEDMARIGCDWPIRSRPIDSHMMLTYYDVPGTDFGRHNDSAADEVYRASGIGLNWGSIIRLSKVCVLGRKFFGEDWSVRFKGKLLNRKDHFSFIEEISWLGLWYALTDVTYEGSPFLAQGFGKKIDLVFTSCGQKVNLEVKFRPKDWMRHVDGPDFNIVMPSFFYDVPDKYPARNEGELNLVGLTVLAAVDRSLRERIQTLLKENPNIDGVVVWSNAPGDDKTPFEIHSANNLPLIRTMFSGGDLEDQAHLGLVTHLWRKRNERRAFRADEVPELLRRLAAENHRVI